METKRNSYRAIICAELGTPDVLRITRLPQPTLGPSDVRVHIVAAGVNFPDVLMVAGEYQFKPVLPFVTGMESAGMVVETGASVKHFRPGDRVIVRQRTKPARTVDDQREPAGEEQDEALRRNKRTGSVAERV